MTNRLELDSVTLFSETKRDSTDLQTVSWLLSNVATSTQATREERVAAMKAMHCQENILKLLAMPNLSLWEIGGAALDFFLYRDSAPVDRMSLYPVMLPDPSAVAVTEELTDITVDYVLDLTKVYRSPVQCSVIIQKANSDLLGQIPWLITFKLAYTGDAVEYIQVDASFRPTLGPDIDALSITYH